MRLAAAVLACATLAAASVSAQTTIMRGDGTGVVMMTSSGPGGDAPDPTGTAVIRGRVVTAETGAVLTSVQIRLSGGLLRQGRNVATDADGRYQIEDLPAGRYTLNATKAGFVSLQYGQRRPFESGRPVEVADKQTVESVDFALPRGGVIVARVTDEFGEPMSGVRVMAERYRFTNGERRLSQVGTGGSPFGAGTDDRGETRLYGLPPGEYYVSANTPQLGGSSAIGAAERGRSYVTTFHPGTASVAEAQKVTVQVGREVGVTFPAVTARLSRVTAVVRSSDGNPLKQPSVSLSYSSGNGGGSRSMNAQPDGSFSIPDVTPGTFTIDVSPPFNDRSGNGEYASVPVTVGGDDVKITITTGKAGRIRGRFNFEGAAPGEVRAPGLRPFFSRVGQTGLVGGVPTVNDDLTFEMAGVTGTGSLLFTSTPAGWYMKELLVDGKDVTDGLLDLSDGKDLNGLEIVMTRVRSEMNGTVVDAQNAPVSEYVAILFPEARDQWTPRSRYFSTARPDQKGAYKMTGLPPGRYLAVAVDYLETGAERDPELLGRLVERATPITLEDGKPQTLNLEVVTY